MRTAATMIGLLALLVVLAPAASAQSTPTDAADRKTSYVTFYGHVFDAGRANPMPMNTEFPAGENDWSAGYGGTCSDATGGGNPAVPTCEEYTFNEVWFISSAGFVDITDDSEFDYAELHNERGLTKPVLFDTGQDVTAVFYMSADAHGWPVIVCNPNLIGPPYPDVDDVPWVPICFNWDPGMLPQWQVQATLYGAVLGEHGSGASEAADIVNAYDSGSMDVIAQGVSTPTDVTSLEAAGFPTVWEFEVNLGKPAVRELSKEKSLVWRVQWWSLAGGTPTLEDNALSWNVNSGEFYPPRIVLPVKNAFDVELVLPQFLHNKLVIHGILNTPWGSYDADPETVALTIATADGGREFEPSRIDVYADYSVAHGGHYRPVNVTYVWDYRGDGLTPGDYRATISAANHQRSASATCQATFRVHGDLTGEVLEVGRCGTVSSGAEDFARRQGSNATGDLRVGDLPLGTLGLQSAEERPTPAPALPLVALGAVAVAALRRRWSA